MFLLPNSNQYQYYCLIVINQKETLSLCYLQQKKEGLDSCQLACQVSVFNLSIKTPSIYSRQIQEVQEVHGVPLGPINPTEKSSDAAHGNILNIVYLNTYVTYHGSRHRHGRRFVIVATGHLRGEVLEKNKHRHVNLTKIPK